MSNLVKTVKYAVNPVNIFKNTAQSVRDIGRGHFGAAVREGPTSSDPTGVGQKVTNVAFKDKTTAPLAPPPTPPAMPDEQTRRDAVTKAITEARMRSGRMSTILSQQQTLG